MGAQTFPATGAVSGQTYTATASGVVTGDVMRVCVDADISTVETDTGLVDFAGSVTQAAADACEITHEIDAACNWTAVGEMIAPDCSAAPASIDCANMPITFNIPNGTAVQSVTPPLIDYAATIASNGDITITPNNAGQGQGGTHTFTIVGTGMTCQFTLDIVECPTAGLPPTLSGSDCPLDLAAEADSSAPQVIGPFCPFTGEGTMSFSGTVPLGWFVQSGNCYTINVPANTPATGGLIYSVTLTNADGSVACIGNELEVIGL